MFPKENLSSAALPALFHCYFYLTFVSMVVAVLRRGYSLTFWLSASLKQVLWTWAGGVAFRSIPAPLPDVMLGQAPILVSSQGKFFLFFLFLVVPSWTLVSTGAIRLVFVALVPADCFCFLWEIEVESGWSFSSGCCSSPPVSNTGKERPFSGFPLSPLWAPMGFQ